MATRLQKLAPIGAVMALGTYLCWPYVSASDPAPAPAAAEPPPAVVPTLLKPLVGAVVERDPFKEVEPPKPPPAAKPAPAKEGQPPASAPVKTEPTPDLAARLADDLRLEAIYIRGPNRMAFISGDDYVEGQALRGADGKPLACVVAAIHEADVVLHAGRHQATLKYKEPAASAQPAPVPKRTTAGKSSGTKKS